MTLNYDARRLRPRRVVEVLDQTFRIYRENFVGFFGLVAVVTTPITLLTHWINRTIQNDSYITYVNEGFFTYQTFDTTAYYTNLLLLMLVVLGGLLLQTVFVYSNITYVTAEQYLGRKVSIVESFVNIKGRILPLIMAYIILSVVLAIGFLLTGVLGIICILPLFALPLVAYYAICGYMFTFPTVILEDLGPFTAISRALWLARTRFWSIFAFVIGLSLIIYVMNFSFGILAAFVTGVPINNFSDYSDFTVNSTTFTIIQALISILIVPILPIGLTLLYFDTRIRAEGLDLALQVAEDNKPRPFILPSPDPNFGLFRATDFANSILMVMGLGVTAGLLLILVLIGSGF